MLPPSFLRTEKVDRPLALGRADQNFACAPSHTRADLDRFILLVGKAPPEVGRTIPMMMLPSYVPISLLSAPFSGPLLRWSFDEPTVAP
jgi:hypothetical protein